MNKLKEWTDRQEDTSLLKENIEISQNELERKLIDRVNSLE